MGDAELIFKSLWVFCMILLFIGKYVVCRTSPVWSWKLVHGLKGEKIVPMQHVYFKVVSFCDKDASKLNWEQGFAWIIIYSKKELENLKDMSCYFSCLVNDLVFTSTKSVQVGTSQFFVSSKVKGWRSCETFCAIWYHLYSLKNMKNHCAEALLLVNLQAQACNFAKSNTTSRVFFTVFKYYKWYQIA